MAKTTKASGKAAAKVPAAGGELTDKKREQALDAALKQIEKNYGVGSIMRLADGQIRAVQGISTGEAPSTS